MKLLRIIFNFIFKRKPPQLSLTHPEEPPDYTRTVENVSFTDTLNKWFIQWKVPEEYWEFWRTKIVVHLESNISYPAGTWEQDGMRHLAVQPAYLNPGVIAHEQAHNSYALLTDQGKANFSTMYHAIRYSDAKIVYLYSINQYGLTSDVEAHAEILRYWGEDMPEALKGFYPKMF